MSKAATAMNGLLECEFFDFASAIVGDTFRIFVAKPAFTEGGKHPVIYAADGNSTFPLVMGIQRSLAWGAEAPAAYVIGVGYPTEDGYLQAISKRNRDYTPTDGGEYARAILGSTVEPGAGKFLRFLIEELMPELEERYSIDRTDATFFGSSLGGLFGAWTLLTAPSTFSRYILASPAISWNGEEVWHWERQFADSQQDLRATVFVSCGALEADEPARLNALRIAANNPLLQARVETMVAWFDRHGWPRTAELSREFSEKLRSRNYASLKIHCHNMPQETHMSVPAAVISRGLRYVFEHWQP